MLDRNKKYELCRANELYFFNLINSAFLKQFPKFDDSSFKRLFSLCNKLFEENIPSITLIKHERGEGLTTSLEFLVSIYLYFKRTIDNKCIFWVGGEKYFYKSTIVSIVEKLKFFNSEIKHVDNIDISKTVSKNTITFNNIDVFFYKEYTYGIFDVKKIDLCIFDNFRALNVSKFVQFIKTLSFSKIFIDFNPEIEELLKENKIEFKIINLKQ